MMTSQHRKIENNLTRKVQKELAILKRHVQILNHIKSEGPIGIIRLSEKTGIPHHKVRYSLRILEDNEIIQPTAEGAILVPRDDDYRVQFRDVVTAMVQELTGINEELKKESETPQSS